MRGWTRRYVLVRAVIVIILAFAVITTVRHYNAQNISANTRTVIVPGQANPAALGVTPTNPVPAAGPTNSTVPITRAVPTVPGPPAGAVSAATGYLTARDNAISANQSSPISWVQAAKPFLTAAFYTQLNPPLAPGAVGPGDFAYRMAHQNGWRVAVQADCAIDEAAAAATPTAVTLLCSLSDLTVDGSGTPVTAASLPGAWVFNGPQTQQAAVALQNVGGTWLVAADETGSPPR